MRRALLSVAVGLAGAAAVTASGWALQAAALPPPTPAARVAADASVWFHEYRFVVAVFHYEHRRTEGACLRGWFRHVHGRKARGSLLSLRSTRSHGARLPRRLAAAAGCSRELARAIVGAAQSGAHLTVSRSYAANRPAIALRVPRGKDKRLTLYVSPRTDRPLVAVVAIADHEATARLYLHPVTRRALARFHLLRRAEPRLR